MIRKYIKGDAQKITAQKEQAEEAQLFASCFDYIHAYTLVDKTGKIYAVFGWRQTDDISGECFALLGDNCQSKLLEIVRFFNAEMPRVMQRYHFKYAFMTVKKKFIEARRLAELLGFSLVADLPLFFDGLDYQLFKRENLSC